MNLNQETITLLAVVENAMFSIEEQLRARDYPSPELEGALDALQRVSSYIKRGDTRLTDLPYRV